MNLTQVVMALSKWGILFVNDISSDDESSSVQTIRSPDGFKYMLTGHRPNVKLYPNLEDQLSLSSSSVRRLNVQKKLAKSVKDPFGLKSSLPFKRPEHHPPYLYLSQLQKIEIDILHLLEVTREQRFQREQEAATHGSHGGCSGAMTKGRIGFRGDEMATLLTGLSLLTTRPSFPCIKHLVEELSHQLLLLPLDRILAAAMALVKLKIPPTLLIYSCLKHRKYEDMNAMTNEELDRIAYCIAKMGSVNQDQRLEMRHVSIVVKRRLCDLMRIVSDRWRVADSQPWSDFTPTPGLAVRTLLACAKIRVYDSLFFWTCLSDGSSPPPHSSTLPPSWGMGRQRAGILVHGEGLKGLHAYTLAQLAFALGTLRLDQAYSSTTPLISDGFVSELKRAAFACLGHPPNSMECNAAPRSLAIHIAWALEVMGRLDDDLLKNVCRDATSCVDNMLSLRCRPVAMLMWVVARAWGKKAALLFKEERCVEHVDKHGVKRKVRSFTFATHRFLIRMSRLVVRHCASFQGKDMAMALWAVVSVGTPIDDICPKFLPSCRFWLIAGGLKKIESSSQLRLILACFKAAKFSLQGIAVDAEERLLELERIERISKPTPSSFSQTPPSTSPFSSSMAQSNHPSFHLSAKKDPPTSSWLPQPISPQKPKLKSRPSLTTYNSSSGPHKIKRGRNEIDLEHLAEALVPKIGLRHGPRYR